jgi:hypothetical protein
MRGLVMIRVLFDQGVPNRLRRHVPGCQVETTQRRGWGTLKNGELLGWWNGM